MEHQVYKHVLVASELSPISDFIANKAKQVANVNQAELSIVHAIQPLVTYASVYFTPDLQAEMIEDAKGKLKELSSKIGVPQENQLIVIANPKEAILDTAQQIGADLIVVGSHHHSWYSPLLGSTASSTVSRATCDVLTIPVRELAKNHIKDKSA